MSFESCPDYQPDRQPEIIQEIIKTMGGDLPAFTDVQNEQTLSRGPKENTAAYYRSEAIRVATGFRTKYLKGELEAARESVPYWGPADALLEDHPGNNSFQSWFGCVMPAGKTVKAYITEEMRANIAPGGRLGLELGGPGIGLFGSFDKGVFDETRAVTLTDPRETGLYKEKMRGRCQNLNHDIIAGDIMSEEVRAKIEEWLEGRRLGCIVQRMFAGIGSIPSDPLIVAQEAEYWYSLPEWNSASAGPSKDSAFCQVLGSDDPARSAHNRHTNRDV